MKFLVSFVSIFLCFSAFSVDKNQKIAIQEARLYFQNGMFDDSLQSLKEVNAQALELEAVTDPESLLLSVQSKFYEMSNYYHLLDKKMTETMITKLLSYFERVADDARFQNGDYRLMGTTQVLRKLGISRYWFLTQMIQMDLASWQERDLGEVARLMNLSRLSLDPDEIDLGDEKRKAIAQKKIAEFKTHTERADKAQKKAIEILEELIKKAEDQQNQQANGNSGKPNDPSKPDQGKNGKSNNQPTKPGENPQGGSGKGQVDERKLREVAAQWGGLPPQERARVVEEITRDLPPKYRELIEAYFKALNRYTPPPK